MTTRRVVKSNNFSIVSNKIIRDTNLSLKARGLLILMLSLPESWEFSIAGLSTLSGEGKDSIRNGVKELENTGYLTRERKHLPNGKLAEMEYVIYEEPITTAPQPAQANTVQSESALENPTQVETTQAETVQGNPRQINKEYNKDYTKASTDRERENNTTVVYQAQVANPLSLLSDKPATRKQVVLQAEYFNRFWEAYPRRSNKLKANLAWNALPVDIGLYDKILLAVEKFKRSRQWQDKLYVPYPETFLVQQRWEDDIPEDEQQKPAKKNDVAACTSSVIARLEALEDD